MTFFRTLTNKKLFLIGAIWLAVFFLVFNNLQEWSTSWCGTHNYSCSNNFETIILILWLLPSLLFLSISPHQRRYVFFIGVIAAFAIAVLSFLDRSYGSLCRYYPEYGYGTYYCEIATSLLLPIVFITPLSILLLLVREEIFRAWLHFAYWWIPVSLVFIYLAGGWSGGSLGIPNVLDQEFVSIIFSGLFVIISLGIVLVSLSRNRL